MHGASTRYPLKALHIVGAQEILQSELDLEICYLLGLREERRVIVHESGYVDTMVARRSKKDMTKINKKEGMASGVMKDFIITFWVIMEALMN